MKAKDLRAPIIVIAIAIGAHGLCSAQSCVIPEGSSPQAVCERRIALVIGNQNYTLSPLQNPLNDAVSIAAVLEHSGFSVQRISDANRLDLEKGVERFIGSLNPGDVALVYYSGHGMQLDGENYLVPIDFSAHNEIDARYGSYSVSRVLDKMTSRLTKLSIVILDACRTNPFQLSRSGAKGWAAMSSGAGAFVAFATAPGKTASDNGSENNGLFTKFLVEVLSGPGDLSLEQVFKKVNQRVYHASNGDQIPWISASMTGDFTFSALPIASSSVASSVRHVGSDFRSGDGVPLQSASRNMLDKSISTLSSAIERDPTDLPSLLLRAQAESASGNFDKAARDFEAVAKLDPRHVEAQRELCRMNLLLKKSDLARIACEKGFALDRRDGRLLHYLGLASIMQRAFGRSIQQFSEAIALRPEYGEAILSRAIAYLAIKEFGPAIVDASTSIRISPRNPLAYMVRGHALRGLGNLTAAQRDWDLASKIQLGRRD